MTKLIKCFTFVHGHKDAQELVTDLNQTKSCDETNFWISYSRQADYSKDAFLIMGETTDSDWTELNLESDFMEL